MKTTYGKPSFEVAKATEVDWAPVIPGQPTNAVHWAYRIKTPTGNTIIGSVRGTKTTAEGMAKRYIERAMFHQPYWAASKRKRGPKQVRKAVKSVNMDIEATAEAEADQG